MTGIDWMNYDFQPRDYGSGIGTPPQAFLMATLPFWPKFTTVVNLTKLSAGCASHLMV